VMRVSRRAIGTGLILLAAAGSADLARGAGEAPSKPEIVVLIHGLGRSPRSMRKLASRLSEAGFETVTFGYPSRKASIVELSGLLEERLEACCADPGRRIHFVTHSLGGILVRQYISGHPLPNLGRVVMIAPPNHGSEVADLLPKVPLAGKIAGPSGEDLGSGPEAAPARLGPVAFDLGVLAGGRSFNPVFSSIIPGPDDGMVAVESARVEGMKDFLVLPHSHTFILKCPETARQAAHFLREGRFDRRESEAAHE